jgi:4a-hydroxytetrahydrobiopterin dehydratase
MNNNIKITDLATQKCLPCRGGVDPLIEPDLSEYLRQLSEGWHIIEERRLEKDFVFKNFADALAFTDKVGYLAEQQGHHPDIFLSWGKVKIQLWTHKINGLHENDFILAAHIDRL